ncbi:MAG: sigma-70 family RNA polymerase sigma factor [Clostridia bacterium]|nr:sigma-70 family RNA polymerase sigma factor [Clostridia bacterium]
MSTENRKRLFVKAVHAKKAGMYRVALVILKSSADAEDACADAIEITLRHLDSIRDDGAINAYLMRCTVNACHAILKKRRKEVPQEDFEAILPPVFMDSPVWMYLSGLDEKYSVPIAMKFSENMTTKEIAEILRLTQGTVSTRISRGLKLLKDQMER